MTTQPSLRPLSTADICDTAFRLYRANLRTFLGVALLLYGPLIGLKFIIVILFLQPANWGASLTWPLSASSFRGPASLNLDIAWGPIAVGLRLLEFLIIQPITVGALCHAAARCYLQQPVSVRAAYKLERLRLINLVYSGNLFMTIHGLMFASLVAILTELVSFRPDIILVLLPLIIGLGISIVYIRLTVAMPAIVIEGCQRMASWSRSWHLTSAAIWQTLPIVVLSNLLMAIMVFPPAFAIASGGRLLFNLLLIFAAVLLCGLLFVVQQQPIP